MQPAILFNGNSVVVVQDGKQYSATKDSHSNYDKILESIKNQEWDVLPELFNVKQAIVKYTNGMVKIVENTLYYDEHPLDNSLTSRILQMFTEGFDITPMVKFLQNLMQNPSRTAVQELYLFLETGNMPITEDGCFLAYKKVRGDFKDIYTGTMDNSPGLVVEIQRNSVDDNRNNTCSYGLHFCSVDYLNYYGTGPSGGNKVVIVKINPKDVVSIPSDYRNTKGRTCKYVVVGEYKDWKPSQEYFDKSVYTREDFADFWDESSEVDNIQDQYDKLEEQLDLIDEKIDDINNQISSIDDSIASIEDSLDHISTSSLVTTMEQTVAKMEIERRNLFDKLDDLNNERDIIEEKMSNL